MEKWSLNGKVNDMQMKERKWKTNQILAVVFITTAHLRLLRKQVILEK